MATIQFLGVGGAGTTLKYFQSNMLVRSGNDVLLIDCGSDIRHSLNHQRLSFRDIPAVFISHLHADHAGGLEWLGFSRMMAGLPRPKLYLGHPDMEDAIWDTLKYGMAYNGGEDRTIHDYFEVVENELETTDSSVSADGVPEFTLDWKSEWLLDGILITAVSQKHAIGKTGEIITYSLIIATPSKRTFITSDTMFPLWHAGPYSSCHQIFHDCETQSYRSNMHPHYEELQTLDEKIRNKMWLYHYNPNPQQNPKEDGFLGFVAPGQIFEL